MFIFICLKTYITDTYRFWFISNYLYFAQKNKLFTYEIFEKDTYEALTSELNHILKYKRILMIQS
ncbi:MAG: hypothetical protein LBG96_12645, partial [Tannerella sp.]|nr:hypothetical protein [Tannerella sp.]